MKFKKIDINKSLILFLFAHLIIWTLVPSISNTNLPLDTIEALAWGSNLDWGYNKHPPVSAWVVKGIFQIFGNQDWVYYFLSQLFVVVAFFVVFKFSEDFFKKKIFSLISVLLLEAIYFHNFTTPEFNVYVAQLPFRALAVYFCWKSFKNNDVLSWLLFGIFLALGLLSHYLFFYLIIAITIFFLVLFMKKKKVNLKYFIPGTIFLILILPHLIWLADNNYTTITYAFHRTGLNEQNYFNHISYPFIFLIKQIGILLPFLFIFLIILSKFKVKIKKEDKKLLFLLIINFIPLILIFLTSVFMGAKIRTMWMSPFYLFMGVLFLFVFQKNIIFKKIKYFFAILLFLFILSPTTYLYVSISQKDKRTDYPGKEIAKIVQEKWDNNFKDEIKSVIGDEWHAGNLSYHLKSNPKWYSHSTAFVEKTVDEFIDTIGKDGFIIVNGECSTGVSFIIKNNNICMNSKK